MMKWKYMTQQFVTDGLGNPTVVERRQAEMTAMGEYGWELVSTSVYHNAEIGQDVLILFYKKAVTEERVGGPVGR
jgi:hypothetical protein